MASEPWWMERVDRLVASGDLSGFAGPLWHLAERLRFVRENVDPQLLEVDFRAVPRAAAVWAEFTAREAEVDAALTAAVADVARSMRSGELGPEAFRRGWEALGFTSNEEGAGTPADDYLDAVSQVSRMTTGEVRPESSTLNMSSRAFRIADFIEVTKPGADDCVFDLGSGSGKFALTIAASTRSAVRGVELGSSYVEQARRSATFLGLSQLHFAHGDVRDSDLSRGSIFYLYYPFHGDVARWVADALGRLARQKDVVIYLSGPTLAFGEHFLRQVESGAMTLSDRRGEFAEVLVLRSARVMRNAQSGDEPSPTRALARRMWSHAPARERDRVLREFSRAR